MCVSVTLNVCLRMFFLCKEFEIKISSFPSTNGSPPRGAVSKSFINVVLEKISKKNHLKRFKMACYKVGILNTKHPKYVDNVIKFNEIFYKNYKTSDYNFLETNVFDHEFFNDNIFSYNVMDSASIKYFLSTDSRSTTPFNALVTGGRINNERYFEYKLSKVADIDLKSWYGSSLSNFLFPIGLPTIFSRTANQPFLTLPDFLLKYSDDLVPHVWKIRVDEELSFEQDLIYSR